MIRSLKGEKLTQKTGEAHPVRCSSHLQSHLPVLGTHCVSFVQGAPARGMAP